MLAVLKILTGLLGGLPFGETVCLFYFEETVDIPYLV